MGHGMVDIKTRILKLRKQALDGRATQLYTRWAAVPELGPIGQRKRGGSGRQRRRRAWPGL